MIVGATIPRVVSSRAKSDQVTLSEGEFTSLYNEYGKGLQAYLARRTGDPALAEDLTQKSFVRLLGAKLVTLDRPALKSYLYRIATNLTNDYWRRYGSELGEDAIPELSSGFGSAALRSDFDRMLGKVDSRDRALLWLAHVEEMSHREIAEILEVGEKSVKVMLFRARKKLAALLREHGYRGGTA